MGSTVHLISRFVGSLRPGGPSADDRRWVEGRLGPAELALWRALSGPDRRHSVAVARRVDAALGVDATDAVLAAALLHDVGKLDAGLRTGGRVVATVSGRLVRRDPDVLRAWSRGGRIARRVGLYLRHPELGAERLAIAGSDPLTVAWAREHHRPPDRCTLPRAVADALRAADDD